MKKTKTMINSVVSYAILQKAMVVRCLLHTNIVDIDMWIIFTFSQGLFQGKCLLQQKFSSFYVFHQNFELYEWKSSINCEPVH